ncbi:MAG: hypothetical protein Kow0047_25810 [Anaerolineae bacterium]
MADVASGHAVAVLHGYVDIDKLEDALEGEQFDVIHFAQHGGAGTLLLSDRPIGLEQLIRMIRRQSQLKLIFVNACDSVEIAAELHNAVSVPVIAHAREVSDEAARAFAGAFYRALDAGVVDAFAEAKAMMRRFYPQYADSPVLIDGHHAMHERLTRIERKVTMLEQKVDGMERMLKSVRVGLTDVLLLVLIALQVWQMAIR